MLYRAGLHPPPPPPAPKKTDRGWVHFFARVSISVPKIAPSQKKGGDFEGDVKS